jgi:hypothetical protein
MKRIVKRLALLMLMLPFVACEETKVKCNNSRTIEFDMNY